LLVELFELYDDARTGKRPNVPSMLTKPQWLQSSLQLCHVI